MYRILKATVAAATLALATIASAPAVDAIETSSWMSNIPDNTQLADLVIPGTHDSCAFDASDLGAKGLVITQSSTLTQQFLRGIRYVDMRVNICQGTTNRLCMFHGRYYLKKNFDSVLQDITSFFALHPSETIVMRLMVEAVDSNQFFDFFAGTQGQIAGFQQLFESQYIDQNRTLWIPSDISGGGGVPSTSLTLGQARSKIVLFWDSGDKTSKYGYDYNSVDTRRSWEFDSYDDMMNTFKSRADTSRRDDNRGWFENPASATVYPNNWWDKIYSWIHKVPHPIDEVANTVQPRVLNELRNGHAMNKGIVSMDYPRDDVIQELIQSSLRRHPK